MMAERSAVQPEPFELEIDLNVLNHLGLNLYSNVPAVLAELIANAWDADATRVEVTVERNPVGEQGPVLVIADSGCGMDEADLRGKYHPARLDASPRRPWRFRHGH